MLEILKEYRIFFSNETIVSQKWVKMFSCRYSNFEVKRYLLNLRVLQINVRCSGGSWTINLHVIKFVLVFLLMQTFGILSILCKYSWHFFVDTHRFEQDTQKNYLSDIQVLYIVRNGKLKVGTWPTIAKISKI